MSDFAMQTAGVFPPLLKPSRYKGAHGAPEGKRNGNYRHELLKLIKSLR